LFILFIIDFIEPLITRGYYACCWLKEIGSLKRLTQLDVSDNKLERLPDTIGQLDRLSDLHLSDNQIDYLPDTLGLLQLLFLENLNSL